MALAVPQGCTNFKLHRLARQLSQHYDAEVRKAGLKTSQYSLLSHVERLGPMRPVDLATAMGMTASTLSRNLQVLMQAGYVAQDAGSDGRSRLVSITEAGSAKRAEAQRHWKTAQMALNARLGNAQVVALHALIDDTLVRLATTGKGSPSCEFTGVDSAD
jgi:DNA-binding MarR family transcriptional regulator